MQVNYNTRHIMRMEQLHNTLALCIILVFIVDRVTSSPSQDASVLCISECGTCPRICSPPPSVESKPPPPSLESKPPPSPKAPQTPTSSGSEPPPYLTPIYHPTPPQSYYPSPSTSPSTSPPRPRTKSCPPPSYIALGANTQPPPPPKVVVVPSTQIPPNDDIGQKNSSNPGYPYYYFYSSKGVAFSQGISRFLILFTCFNLIFLLIG